MQVSCSTPLCVRVFEVELEHSWHILCEPPGISFFNVHYDMLSPQLDVCNLLLAISFHSMENVVFMGINLISYSYRWNLYYVYGTCSSSFIFAGLLLEHLITCIAIVDLLLKELYEFSLPASFLFSLYYHLSTLSPSSHIFSLWFIGIPPPPST